MKNISKEEDFSRNRISNTDENTDFIPKKAWFTLKEACSLKGLNYKTACNRTILQPNKGVPDGRVGGRKVFKRETILHWINLTDAEILSENKSGEASS